jgi:ATP-dependent DNA helicase RecQ
MLAAVITLRFNPVLGGFDDAELRRFIVDKEVLSIREHFFVYEHLPHIAFTVVYRPVALAAERQATPAGARPRDESWRKLLAEQDIPIFNQMRDWRAEKAKDDGVPPYVIFTNKQLARIVKAKPNSLADLARVEGLGKAKLEKYGEAILSMLVTPIVAEPTVKTDTATQEADDGP